MLITVASANWRKQAQSWPQKIPWRRAWQPSPAFLPGESHGQRRLLGSTVPGVVESDLTEGHFKSSQVARWWRDHLLVQKVQETQVPSLGREGPLEAGTATHSSVLAWRIPRTEEPRGLQSPGWRRVGHDWARMHTHTVLIRAASVSWRKRAQFWLQTGTWLDTTLLEGYWETVCFVGKSLTAEMHLPCVGLGEMHRWTSKQITVTERSFIWLLFPFSRGRRAFVWLPKIWLSILLPLAPSHPHLSSLTTFWFKAPDCVILSCSHARPVLPAHRASRVLSKLWERLKALMNF